MVHTCSCACSIHIEKRAMPEDKHIVALGNDYRFLNNYFIPYNPKTGHDHYE
jgi:hypothetical protein